MVDDRDIEMLIRRGLEESGLPGDNETIVSRLSCYTAEIQRWNRKINLTGKRTGREIVTDLFYDAFFIYLYIKGEGLILDMGSGAGVIGIPLAILDSHLNIVSVDASVKRTQFQRHIKRTLGLDNLVVLPSRIEDLEPQGVGAVVAKAFGSTGDVLNNAMSHLRPEGHVLLMKGKSEPERGFPGFLLENSILYRLPGSAKEFKLLIYKKVP